MNDVIKQTIQATQLPEYLPILKNELAGFKQREYETQAGICPIVKKEFSIEEMVVDHTHRIKDKQIGEDNSQLVRGIICNGANRLEGAIKSRFVRYGLSKHISLPEFLRNLAAYLENPPLGGMYIHPNELPKKTFEKFSKNDYKLICKYWSVISKKADIPPYPESRRMTKVWKSLLEKAKKEKELQNRK